MLVALRFGVEARYRRNLLYILLAIFTASLAYSVWFTHSSPAQGYFSTFTRLWELAARTHLVIVGDSHAAQYLPTLIRMCDSADCRVTSITKGACPLVDVEIVSGKARTPYRECTEWNDKAPGVITSLDPDAVLYAMSRGHRVAQTDDEAKALDVLAEAATAAWTALEAQGIPVIALSDTERLGKSPVDCMSKTDHDAQACRRIVADLPYPVDPVRVAAQANGQAFVDMSSSICPDGICHPVIGNILVWRDSHHITASYARTLAPEMARQLREAGVRF